MDHAVLERTLANMASAAAVPIEDLRAIAAEGEARHYPPGAVVFYQSTPRQWMGVVLEGEVAIEIGLYGATTQLSILTPGAIIAEAAMLDDHPHHTSAVARTAATVWQIERATWEKVRRDQPEVFYRILARTVDGITERLHLASQQLVEACRKAPEVGAFRREHDLLGDRDLPDAVYWGVQTLRATENFPLSGIRFAQFEHFVDAFAYVKKAAALANCELGMLDAAKKDAIAAACDEILAGKLRDQFVVDMFQGGAGTSSNMNANEVIANRALEVMGHRKGEYRFLHPNDDVNCSQSTNDAYPTAIKLGVYFSMRDTISALRTLKESLEEKAKEFADVLKMGRTENQDAVPMTLGQEFGAYAIMVNDGMRALGNAGDDLLTLNMGATAIGTGINAPPGYADLVTERLAELTGLPVTKAPDLVEATQDSGEFAQMSANMKRAAIQISKICNDLRWLSSGPRCGLSEIRLPAMQPGSSIMPGKVNPVIPEAVNQVCYQIIGYDVAVSMAAEASELELNMAEPLLAFNLLHGLMLLKNAAIILAARCVRGIVANRERCREFVENSIGLVTALNPVLGYERSVAIAKEALATGNSVYNLVLEKGWLTKEALDEILSPEKMTHPRRIPRA